MRKAIIAAAFLILFTACTEEPNLPVSAPESFTILFDVPGDTETAVPATFSMTMATTTPQTSLTQSSSATDDFTDPYEKEMDDRTDQLFKALTTGDKETLSFLGTGRMDRAEVYDFIDNITFGEYEITPIKAHYLENYGIDKKDYEIKLEVIKSDDERFPEGTHTYYITTLKAIEGAFFTQLLRDGEPAKQAIVNSYNGGGLLTANAYTCYDLTLEMLPFYGRESADSFAVPKENTREFYSGLSRFFSHITVIENGETPENFNAAAKSYFGIDTAFDETNIDALWYGANSLESVLVSETENSVVIDYYADSLFLVKAFTVKYNFDTTNGFRFISIENLYDSGFEANRHTT